MKNRKIIFIIIGVVVSAITTFVIWKKSVRSQLILANPPIEQLLFVKKTGEEFAPEQQRSIKEFKAKILARAALGVKLTEKEREIFNVVISDQEALMPNGDIIVNQSILKLTDEEFNLISGVLKK